MLKALGNISAKVFALSYISCFILFYIRNQLSLWEIIPALYPITYINYGMILNADQQLLK